MKKVVIGIMVCVMLLGIAAPMARAEKNAGAATILSAVMPGCGEWYNSGWKGSFPFGECILGYLCFLVQLSSIMDAANGDATSNIRIDFWSAPGSK